MLRTLFNIVSLAVLVSLAGSVSAETVTPENHTGHVNPWELTGPAYDLANAAESMSREAYGYRDLSWVANDLHMRASDLYWWTRGGSHSPRPLAIVSPENHTDPGADDLNQLWDRVVEAYYQLQTLPR